MLISICYRPLLIPPAIYINNKDVSSSSSMKGIMHFN